MRAIGEFSSEQEARLLGDYLYAKGIGNDVDEEDHEWTLWIHDDDQLDQATAELETFRTNPTDRQYAEGARQAVSLRKKEATQDALAAKRQVDVRTQVFGQNSIGTPYLTFFMLGLCVLVQALAVAEKDLSRLHISGIDLTTETKSRMTPGKQLQYRAGKIFLPEVTGQKVRLPDGEKVVGRGQVWRLVTPIFLHCGWMHIIFNLYWLYFLGGGMEGGGTPTAPPSSSSTSGRISWMELQPRTD